jgi:uncharacterized protein (DUF169 family)
MTDLKHITDLLIKHGKVRGKPVGISLFRDRIPAEYEPIQDTPCAIVHCAMDDGRRVYFDAEHHDCLVGVHHAGITPGKKEIVSGAYLSETSSFFTAEGAARLKAGTHVLPPGMVQAIGAAPLDQVPEGVQVDWIVAVCNPHNANMIAGCRLCQDGIPPYGTFGTSLCGELFAVPWYINNVMVVGGDFGGRMHNRIKQDELFVIIPIAFADYLPRILGNVKVDVKGSRVMTKPAHSPFWHKKDTAAKVQAAAGETQPAASPTFGMAWDDESKRLIQKVPAEMLEMVIGNAEEFARSKGYARVTRKSLDEQMASLGMNLDEMLNEL